MGIVTDNIIYAGSVMEFLRTSGDLCHVLETADEKKRIDFIRSLQRLLPELYFRIISLPKTEPVLDDSLDKHVNESDWNAIHNSVLKKLGPYDSYQEVFDPIRQESEEPISASLSDNLADIYQDISDFVINYGRGDNEIMNDAIWDCTQNFEAFWGQKLTNALRAIHNILYSSTPIEDENEEDDKETPKDDMENINTQSWILSKMQGQYTKGEDE